MKYLSGILIFLSFASKGQISDDSLNGYFIGEAIYILQSEGGIDTNKASAVVQLIADGDFDCIMRYKEGGVSRGQKILSTFELDICDRNQFEVNVDSIAWAENPWGNVFFFGMDSIVHVSSGNLPDPPFYRVINLFYGVRDPNYQSISPPVNKEDLKVFPNPANHNVTIQFPEPGILKVFNMLGQVQVQLPFSVEHQLNVEHWSEGVYIVELEVEETKIRQRVVVQ